MIVISLQPTKLLWFLRTLQLSSHVAVLRTVMRLNRQAAVGPQLPLGAESVRCLNQRNQQNRPDRTNRRNLAQQFPRAMISTLRQEISPHLLAQRLQCVELL